MTSSAPGPLDRWLARIVLLLLSAFALLMGAAMAVYPGGTWEDPKTAGHSLLANYFCDLLRPVALNGQPNAAGAQAAWLGLLSLAAALGPFFWIAPWCFSERLRLRRFVRIAGVVTGIAGVAVVAMPSYRVGALVHGLVVLSAAGPGLAATIGTAVGLLTSCGPSRRIAAFAVATLAFTAAAVAIFVRQLSLGVVTTPGLAALQKLAAASAMLWMAATALRIVAPSPAVAPAASPPRA